MNTVERSSGVLDFTNFEPILLPLGISLVLHGNGWRWFNRFLLFVLACYSALLAAGSLLMSDQTEFLVLEFGRQAATASGTGLVVLMHGLYLAAILWVYFSIFGARTQNASHIN